MLIAVASAEACGAGPREEAILTIDGGSGAVVSLGATRATNLGDFQAVW